MNKDDLIKLEILTHAAKLFQKWGYNKTTVEDIAKAAGKGKSSLYYYYNDKEEIFVEVITREAHEILSLVSVEMKKYETAEEKLTVYIETFLHEFKKSSNLYNIICGEIGGNIPLLQRLGKNFDAMQVDVVQKILESGIERKEFFLPKDVDSLAISSIIVNSIGIVQLDELLFSNSGNSNAGSIMSWVFMHGLKKRHEE